MPSWYLLLALLFIIANGFFVAAEFAIIKVRPTQLAEMAAEGSTRARMARRIIKKLDSYLSATQLGVTLASLALGWVGEPAFAALIQPRLAFLGVYSVAVAHTIAASIAFIVISVAAHHLRRARSEVPRHRQDPRHGALVGASAPRASTC